MARLKKHTTPNQASSKPENRRPSNAERSAYFARREAAKVLRTVLQGDSKRRAAGSIKSLVYSPTVRNKKGTFALVCQTLKYLPVIQDVLDSANVLNSKWKRQLELVYIVTYDILFGQETSLFGDAENFLLLRITALQSALAQHLVRKGVKSIQDLMASQQSSDIVKPRYVRVNTLKMGFETALYEMGKQHKVHKDDMVPDLLVLPPGVDLHNHPLIINGSVFMQGRASSMAAVALKPEPGWEVLDACAAPGNKTVHLAALTKGKGRIIACELNKDRLQRLKDTIKLAGAANVEALHEDFLNLNPKDPSYSKVRAILLDPSCSGSGTGAVRLDHLLPSHGSDESKVLQESYNTLPRTIRSIDVLLQAEDLNKCPLRSLHYLLGSIGDEDFTRLRKLQAFQKKALAHALSFPAVERLVYSTCSTHQIENEDVIKSILPLASSLGFQLATPFPQWPRRGLPVVEGSEHLLRTDPVEDKEGFFIALFVKKTTAEDPTITAGNSGRVLSSQKNLKRAGPYWRVTRLSKMLLLPTGF